MLIIGERINATRKTMGEAIRKLDKKFIQDEAVKQVNAGADYIDINCGTDPAGEVESIEWLVKIVEEVVSVPLVIDSSNPVAVKKGLDVCTRKVLINSINYQTADTILPLVKQYGSQIVALTLDEGTHMPDSAEERLSIAKKIMEKITKYDIAAENVYFDPLVRPISTEPNQAKEFLESIKLIKSTLGAKTVCGLSNISFGLPNRKLINSTFLAMALVYGLDAAIIDPTDKIMISTIKAGHTLLCQDDFCADYIAAYRNGTLIS